MNIIELSDAEINELFSKCLDHGIFSEVEGPKCIHSMMYMYTNNLGDRGLRHFFKHAVTREYTTIIDK